MEYIYSKICPLNLAPGAAANQPRACPSAEHRNLATGPKASLFTCTSEIDEDQACAKLNALQVKWVQC